MSAITRVFEKMKPRGESGLIGYITAGDPAPEYTPLIAEALINGGVDILELGLPFSDPIADGPTIQAASVRALSAGTTPKLVLEMAREIKLKNDVPVVIMTYYNPVFRMGLERFFVYARDCSVDGLIVPDLPVEESADYREKAQANGVDTIFLAAPSTSTERLQRIVASSSGFLYLISHFGVTGERDKIEDSTIQLIKRVLPYTKGRVPLAVGFGISKPEHARRIIEAGADAVIVGSAFVNVVQENAGGMKKTVAEIGAVAQKMKDALKVADEQDMQS
jgi:tryptophan synthase alpha chain